MAQMSASSYVSHPVLHSAGFQFPVTAGNVFCTVTPPPGHYRIEVHRLAYGNGTPSVANNSNLGIGATNHVLSTGAIIGSPYFFTFYAELDGATEVKIQAIANGSANIGVTASLTLTRLV